MLLLAGGCGVPAVQAPGGPHQATTAGCAAYGVRAIERHVTVIRVPAPCQGLSRAEINQAAAMAIRRVSGSVPKAVSRRRATAAAPYLAHLITAPAAGRATPAGSWSAPAAPGSGPAASGPAGGKDLPMDLAALAAWLVTAGSGAYLLSRWVSRGGRLRLRAPRATRAAGDAGDAGPPLAAGSPPAVLLGHFGLALGGLLLWLIYLVTGWPALAWAAVGVLLPVAGLGMATLVVGLPGHSPSVLPVQQAPVLAGRLAADRPAGPPGAGGAQADDAGQQPRATAGRLSALAVAGHGLLAVTTMLLVILAALGTVSR
jgi:manganese efflux pump family protein